MECQGPCILHCYKKNSLILIILGFLLGVIFMKIMHVKKNKSKPR